MAEVCLIATGRYSSVRVSVSAAVGISLGGAGELQGAEHAGSAENEGSSPALASTLVTVVRWRTSVEVYVLSGATRRWEVTIDVKLVAAWRKQRPSCIFLAIGKNRGERAGLEQRPGSVGRTIGRQFAY